MCVYAHPQEAERRLSEAAGGHATLNEAREREWALRLQDVELSWEKRLRDG